MQKLILVLTLIGLQAAAPLYAIEKNVAGQKLTVFAYDTATNAPKTGDAANITAYVSKDDGTPTALADTSASEKSSTNAKGYYTFDLTQAEVNAKKLDFTAKSSTSGVEVLGAPAVVYTTPENFALDSRDVSPNERELLLFDGRVRGDMATSFTRNVKSCDRFGNPVGINERRYDCVDRLVCGYCDWQETNHDMADGGTAYLFAPGKDLSGQRIIAASVRSSASEIKVLEIDDKGFQVKELTSTLASALPGAGAGVAYGVLGTRIYDGSIVLLCSRATSGNYDGLALIKSSDLGLTWTLISASATDGGAAYFPIPAAYGSNANGVARGGPWSIRIIPHGGLDADGRPKSRTRAWILVEDYLRGNANAKGCDCWLIPMTRNSEDEPWQFGAGRRIWSTYSTGYTSNVHCHSFGMLGSGIMLANTGDSTGKTSLQAFELDLDNYATAPITRTEIFGELAASGTAGRSCPQLFGMAAGPDGSLICGADLWPSPIMVIGNMTSVTDKVRISSPFLQQTDTVPGGIHIGFENFQVHESPWGWTVGGVAATNTGSRGMRFYSPDGKRWTPINNTLGLDEAHFCAGDALIASRCLDPGTEGSPTPDQAVNYRLVMCPKPAVRSMRPLCLAPGADNILHAGTTLQAHGSFPPTSPATVVSAKYETGRHKLVSNSAVIANTPLVPAPGVDPLLMYCDNAATSSNFNGIWYARTSGNTSSIGSNFIQMTYAVANCSPNAVGMVQTSIGATSLTNDKTPTTGIFTDRSTYADNPWTTMVNAGDPANNATSASRMEMSLAMGPNTGTMNKGCQMMFAWLGVFITPDGLTPYPVARNTTGNNHEKEVSTIGYAPAPGYTWTVTPIRSDEQASYAGTIPSAQIYTLRQDANNYITIAVDGSAFSIVVTATVNGSTADTETIDFDNWRRGQALVIKVSGDRTETRVSILAPYEGIKTATLTAVVDWPKQLIYGNVDHTVVYNMLHAGAEFRPRSMTFDEMRREHVSLDCLATDEQITADAVAASVDEQLRFAFADVPASVWLETIAGKAKADSAALNLANTLTQATNAMKPTTLGRTLDVLATGEAGIDLGNVANQGATLNLAATTIWTAANLTANNDKANYGLAAGTITSAKFDGTTAAPLSSTQANRLDAAVSSRSTLAAGDVMTALNADSGYVTLKNNAGFASSSAAAANTAAQNVLTSITSGGAFYVKVDSLPEAGDFVSSLNLDSTYQQLQEDVQAAKAAAEATPSASAVASATKTAMEQAGSLLKGTYDRALLALPSAGPGNPSGLPRVNDLPEGGGGGGGVRIPVNQVAVPESRTWKLEARIGGLVAAVPRTLTVGEPQLFAVDFTADLANNGRIVAIESIAIVSGPADGVTWSLDEPEDAGVDKVLAKARLTGVTPGTYTLDVTARRSEQDGGGPTTGRVQLIAKAAPPTP